MRHKNNKTKRRPLSRCHLGGNVSVATERAHFSTYQIKGVYDWGFDSTFEGFCLTLTYFKEKGFLLLLLWWCKSLEGAQSSSLYIVCDHKTSSVETPWKNVSRQNGGQWTLHVDSSAFAKIFLGWGHPVICWNTHLFTILVLGSKLCRNLKMMPCFLLVASLCQWTMLTFGEEL